MFEVKSKVLAIKLDPRTISPMQQGRRWHQCHYRSLDPAARVERATATTASELVIPRAALRFDDDRLDRCHNQGLPRRQQVGSSQTKRTQLFVVSGGGALFTLQPITAMIDADAAMRSNDIDDA